MLATISKHKKIWAQAQVPNQDLEAIQANMSRQQHHLQRLQRKLRQAASQLGIEWGPILNYQPAPVENISQGPRNHWHQLQRLIYLLQQCQQAIELRHRHCAEQYQYLFYRALDDWESELDEFHVTPPPGRELLPWKEEWCEDVEEETVAEELVAAMAQSSQQQRKESTGEPEPEDETPVGLEGFPSTLAVVWDEVSSLKSSDYAAGQPEAQPRWDSQAPKSSGNQVIPNPQESRWEEFEARDKEYSRPVLRTNCKILVLGQSLSEGVGYM